MKHSIIFSADGSHTLKLDDFDECYHSSKGAYSEARHIYIECGVEFLWRKIRETSDDHSVQDTIEIYDIGLGTALNAIATIVWQEEMLSTQNPVPHIRYNGIEKFPISFEEAMKLNFAEHITEWLQSVGSENVITAERLQPIFEMIHRCNWEEDVEITPHFTLNKHQGDITTENGKYFSSKQENAPAVIMYDTFSPATQPQLWDIEIFRKIAQNATPGSILTTYCSKGTVKQALREAGFSLERLSGPPGKRHILRATI